jgi:hypothetical protein
VCLRNAPVVLAGHLARADAVSYHSHPTPPQGRKGSCSCRLALARSLLQVREVHGCLHLLSAAGFDLFCSVMCACPRAAQQAFAAGFVAVLLSWQSQRLCWLC